MATTYATVAVYVRQARRAATVADVPMLHPCGMFVSVQAHLQLGVVRLPEAVAAARPAMIENILCEPKHPGQVPDRSRRFTGASVLPQG